MIEPVAVYLDPVDHDAIERELDEQMGLTPKPPKWRPVGPALTCEHGRITREPVGDGLTVVSCACGHGWSEVG